MCRNLNDFNGLQRCQGARSSGDMATAWKSQGHVLCSPAWGFVLGSRQVFPRSLLLGAWEPYCHDFMLVGRFIRSANITLVRSILH